MAHVRISVIQDPSFWVYFSLKSCHVFIRVGSPHLRVVKPSQYKLCIIIPYLVKCKYLFFTQVMVAFFGSTTVYNNDNFEEQMKLGLRNLKPQHHVMRHVSYSKHCYWITRQDGATSPKKVTRIFTTSTTGPPSFTRDEWESLKMRISLHGTCLLLW
jgi:hypothetical protein